MIERDRARSGRPSPRRRLAALVAALAALSPMAIAATPAGAAGGAPLNAVAPARLLDTRAGGATVDGLAVGYGKVTALALSVAGRAGVAADALAAIVNVTVTEPEGNGYLTVFPCGAPVPLASNLNFGPGQTVPNLVMAKLGTGGEVCLVSTTPTHVIVDLNGWYPAGAVVAPTAPARLADTRPGEATVDGSGAGNGKVTALGVTVGGRAGVAGDAVAAVLNVTVTAPDADGYLTVYPCGEAPPFASNLNFRAGQTVPNLVIAKVGAGGGVCFASPVPTHVVVDLNGWYPPGAAIAPMAPARLADTRPGAFTVDGMGAGAGPPGAGVVFEVAVNGRAGIPTDASAAVLNVTVTDPAGPGYLTVFPCGSPQPLASNLNYVTSQTVPNLVVARLGAGGRVCIYTTTPTHLVVDVNGWLSGPPPPPLAATTMLGGCPVFPADNPWNQVVSGLPLRAESAGWVASVGGGDLHPDFGSNPGYGIPYVVVGQSQPLVPVTFDAYGSQSDPGPYPIPTSAPVEAGSDRHVLALQQGTCRLYELYNARVSGGGWLAASGAVFDLRSNALRPNTWTSADAAGLPILPGLVRYDEVRSGQITHALRFTVPATQQGFIHPATHYAGNTPSAPPMGARFRLKASFDINAYHGDARVILQALRTYGMIVADNGSGWYITGATDGRWDDDDLDQLKSVPGSAFEVVDTGPIRTS